MIESEASRPARPGERLVGILSKAFRGHKIDDASIYDGIEDFVEMFSRAPGDPVQSPMDAARARAADFVRRTRQQQAQQAQRPPPPPPRPRPAGPDPRVVLGFAVGQKVTAADVKKRHRELARKHHPDRGGNLQRMQEINQAVDAILATL